MIPLIDTHTHLIHRADLGYSWTKSIPQIGTGDFTTADYFAMAGEAVSDAVYMEMAVDGPEGYKDEARLLSRMMRAGTERLSGLVPSCRPENAEGFEAWIEECAALGASGFRRVLHEMPDEMSRTQTYRANVRAIGRLGLPYDLSYNAAQLGIARELALACPDVTLVLNHCGVPRIAEDAFASWRQGISALAESPNVYCKLSGITAYCGPNQDKATAIAPYVDHVLEAFSPYRLVWGSDWPVVDLGAGLNGWLSMTRTILSTLSLDEANAVAADNALGIYRLSR